MTAPPKVVAERASLPKTRPYPAVVSSHPWSAKEVEGRLDFLLSKTAEQKVRNHCLENPAVEVMGLLVGEVCDDGAGAYAFVRDAVTSPVSSDATHVEFDRSALDELAEALDLLGYDYRVIGWYHSHPGHGCFLSDTDIATQKGCFKSPLSSALVVDPVKLELSIFRMAGDEVVALPVGVCLERYEDPFVLPEMIALSGRHAE